MDNMTPNNPIESAPISDLKRKARVRLLPNVRIQQILDQALIEFSQRGFEAARMDSIAQRCGLSKGGLYAHFKSKDALFESLLTRSLAPPDLKKMDLPRPVPVPQLAVWIVDRMYESLAQPRTIATMRLLIAEGSRVPHLIKLWRRQVVEPYMDRLGALLRESTAERGATAPVIVREPWLVAAPALHVMVLHLILGEHQSVELNQYRQAHIEMLCALLEPSHPVG